MNATIFRAGSYSLEPFHLFDQPIERATEKTLLPEGISGRLGCGVFAMERNGFSLKYPREEVMMILAGELTVKTDEGTDALAAGDILRVPKGLEAHISTESMVRILYVSNPNEGDNQQ